MRAILGCCLHPAELCTLVQSLTPPLQGEFRFNLFGLDGRVCVWRQPHEEDRMDRVRSVVKHGGGLVMVWGCFSSGGVGDPVSIDQVIRGVDYTNILDQHWHRSATAMGVGDDLVFQQGNDPKYTSRAVKSSLQGSEVRVLRWPACSPDLNPIEHIWDVLGRGVAKKRVNNNGCLKRHVQDARSGLDHSILDKLVSSIPRRLAEVVDNKDGHTKNQLCIVNKHATLHFKGVRLERSIFSKPGRRTTRRGARTSITTTSNRVCTRLKYSRLTRLCC